MEGIISGGRNYEDFKRQVPAQILPLFESVRDFCLGLGDDVIEDVRMHRVVFCKSMTFRWFADVAPDSDGITIKIQRGRREPPQIIEIKAGQDSSEYTSIIKEAFEKIR